MKRLPLLLPLLAGLLLCGAAAQPAVTDQPVAATDTRFRSQKLEMRNVGDETITILTGSVEITSVDLQITCDRLEIVSRRADANPGDLVAKQNQFKSLVANGRVRIVQPESRREATCGRAEILPGDGRITLTDKPILVDRDEKGAPVSTLKGAAMRLFKGESRVEIDLPEGETVALPDLGHDPAKPDATRTGPAPAAAPAPIQLSLPGAAK
jgi:lipopolysaccharide export system protein LptA